MSDNTKHKHKNFEKNEHKKSQQEPKEAPVDPFDGQPKDDFGPPQDLNLKLQIEKENSIALTNMLKQLQADFENYRKRNQNLKQESYQDGISAVIKRMLNCYDAIEGALNSLQDPKVKEGIEILKREFLNAFSEFGVEPIEAKGKPFDPNFHNALSVDEKSGKPSGTIVTEIQKGFKNKDKIIRHSLVIIAK